MTIYQCDCSTGSDIPCDSCGILVDERRIDFVKGRTLCSTCNDQFELDEADRIKEVQKDFLNKDVGHIETDVEYAQRVATLNMRGIEEVQDA